MSKKTLMAMFLTFVAVAPAGAADADKAKSQDEMVAASDYTKESVDCFYDQNRYMTECKK